MTILPKPNGWPTLDGGKTDKKIDQTLVALYYILYVLTKQVWSRNHIGNQRGGEHPPHLPLQGPGSICNKNLSYSGGVAPL